MYFRDIDEGLRRDAGPQLRKVLQFRSEVSAEKRLLCQSYATPESFEELIDEHLMRLINSRIKRSISASPSTPEGNSISIAATSLLELTGDPFMTPERLAGRWTQSMNLAKPPILPSAFGSASLWRLTFLDAAHGVTLVLGSTGSGKTEALISLAASMALSLSPDLLRLFILASDFRGHESRFYRSGCRDP
jgi:hypothetical protein